MVAEGGYAAAAAQTPAVAELLPIADQNCYNTQTTQQQSL